MTLRSAEKKKRKKKKLNKDGRTQKKLNEKEGKTRREKREELNRQFLGNGWFNKIPSVLGL